MGVVYESTALLVSIATPPCVRLNVGYLHAPPPPAKGRGLKEWVGPIGGGADPEHVVQPQRRTTRMTQKGPALTFFPRKIKIKAECEGCQAQKYP